MLRLSTGRLEVVATVKATGCGSNGGRSVPGVGDAVIYHGWR